MPSAYEFFRSRGTLSMFDGRPAAWNNDSTRTMGKASGYGPGDGTQASGNDRGIMELFGREIAELKSATEKKLANSRPDFLVRVRDSVRKAAALLYSMRNSADANGQLSKLANAVDTLDRDIKLANSENPPWGTLAQLNAAIAAVETDKITAEMFDSAAAGPAKCASRGPVARSHDVVATIDGQVVRWPG